MVLQVQNQAGDRAIVIDKSRDEYSATRTPYEHMAQKGGERIARSELDFLH